MSERAGHVPVSREPEVDRPAARAPESRRAEPKAERRRVDDRRIASDAKPPESGGRRGRKKSLFQRILGIAARDALIIIGSLGAIVYSARSMRPIFANQPTVVQKLTSKTPIAKAVLAPTPA